MIKVERIGRPHRITESPSSNSKVVIWFEDLGIRNFNGIELDDGELKELALIIKKFTDKHDDTEFIELDSSHDYHT